MIRLCFLFLCLCPFFAFVSCTTASDEPSCHDAVKNITETDVDCGGSCDDCVDGKVCTLAADCVSGVCTDSICQIPNCSDGVKNGTEISADCGGVCIGGCLTAAVCEKDLDCASERCELTGSSKQCIALIAEASASKISDFSFVTVSGDTPVDGAINNSSYILTPASASHHGYLMMNAASLCSGAPVYVSAELAIVGNIEFDGFAISLSNVALVSLISFLRSADRNGAALGVLQRNSDAPFESSVAQHLALPSGNYDALAYDDHMIGNEVVLQNTSGLASSLQVASASDPFKEVRVTFGLGDEHKTMHVSSGAINADNTFSFAAPDRSRIIVSASTGGAAQEQRVKRVRVWQNCP